MEIKEKIAAKLVNCNTHFENDQLVAVLDVCDELGIPDMYEALRELLRVIETRGRDADHYGKPQWRERLSAKQALAKAEEK